MNRNEKNRKLGCLKRALLIGLALGLFSAPAVAQSFVYRVDPTPVMTTRGNVPAGGFPQLYVVPGATITLCTDATCTMPATTYTNAMGDSPCPTTAQVTLPGSALCASTAGPQGQFGFWIQPGTYYYKIVATTGTFGPFPISSPTLGTLGGPGTVSVNSAGGLSVIPQIQECSHFTGASAGAKIIACIAALPDGGVADARSIIGAQTITSTITVSVPLILLLGPATYTTVPNPAFSSTSPMTVIGSGVGITIFQQNDTTSNVFNHAGTGAFNMSGVTIQSQSHQTSGAAVTITGDGVNANQQSVIEHNTLSGQWISVDIGQAIGYRILSDQVQDIRSRGVRANNTVNGDAGDNYIEAGNGFFPPDPYVSGAAAIELVAGGGLIVDGNKFGAGMTSSFDQHIKVNWNTLAGSSQLSIHNNNMEAATTGGQAILLSQTSGTLAGISISNNYYNGQDLASGKCGNFLDLPANVTLWSSQWVIANNNIILGNCGIAFNLVGFAGAQASYTGNHVFGNAGTSQGFSCGANLASLHIAANQVLGTGVTDTCTPATGLRGNYEPDNLGIGIPEAIGLTNPLNLPNNKFIAFRDPANSIFYQALGVDNLGNIILSNTSQPIVTGSGPFTDQGTMSSPHYLTSSNCITNASPAACTSLTAGVVGIPAGGSTIQVNTTAITANSELFLTIDTAHNIGTTCDTGTFLTVPLYLVAINPGISFTVGTSATITALKAGCVHFLIVN